MTATTLHQDVPPGRLLDERAAATPKNLDAAHCDGEDDTGAAEKVELLRTLGLVERSVVADRRAGREGSPA